MTGFFPKVLGRRVDGSEESNDPGFQGPFFNGDEGKGDAEGNGNKNERPLDEPVQGKTVDNQTGDEASGKLAELFKGHVADQTKFV